VPSTKVHHETFRRSSHRHPGYILLQIFIAVIQSGVISPFIVGYVLGVLTPVVIAVQIFKVGATHLDNSALNTTMGKIRGML
jgi:hypothetical protein